MLPLPSCSPDRVARDPAGFAPPTSSYTVFHCLGCSCRCSWLMLMLQSLLASTSSFARTHRATPFATVPESGHMSTTRSIDSRGGSGCRGGRRARFSGNNRGPFTMSHFVCAMMRLICRSQQRMASMSAGSRICTLPPWELAISVPLSANWLIRIAAFARRSMSVRANSNFWRILVSTWGCWVRKSRIPWRNPW